MSACSEKLNLIGLIVIHEIYANASVFVGVTAAQPLPVPKPLELMHLAANVRRYRQERALTQESLAAAAVLEARYVQRIEAMDANPTVTVLAALAAALGVDIRALFEPAALGRRRVGRPRRG